EGRHETTVPTTVRVRAGHWINTQHGKVLSSRMVAPRLWIAHPSSTARLSSLGLKVGVWRGWRAVKNKKADVLEHLAVFDHVGLLVSGPPGLAGLPFI